MIFVDTGAWYAATVPDDPDHPRARTWLAGNREPLLTTDYIVDELLTLMKVRGHYRLALSLGRRILAGRPSNGLVEWVTAEDIVGAWNVFERYKDKEWSFTDCVSRVVMERCGIKTAFAFDAHIRQFGTIRVVPDVTD